MLGKLLKKILLTREARDALERRQAAGAAPKRTAAPPSAAPQQPSPASAGTEEEGAAIEAALAAARQEGAAAESVASVPPAALPGNDHDRLVASAMSVYRQKQTALSQLDPESRKKLRLMANAVFGVTPKN